jgi:hypothetical protein
VDLTQGEAMRRPADPPLCVRLSSAVLFASLFVCAVQSMPLATVASCRRTV